MNSDALKATSSLLFHSGLETQCDMHLLRGSFGSDYDSSSYISIVTSEQHDKA